MTECENEKIIEKIFEAWNRRDFEAYMSHLSNDVKIVWPTGRTVDKETFHRQLSTEIMPVFPDGVSRIDRMISQGNTVCVEWTFTGTHTREFFGIPATNKKIEFPEVYIYDFEAGKVKLLKVHVNQLRVLKQIKEKVRANALLKVATVCMNAVLDKEANLQTFFRYMEEAAAQGAQLIVFPEVSLQQNPGWGLLSVHEPTHAELKYLRDTAETVPGESTDSIMARAGELGIYVVFGMTEKESEDGPLYNTSVFVGADGVIGKYRKSNLWDAEHGKGNEHLCWKRGTELVVADSPWGEVGLAICIDMGHLLGPKLAARGADLLVTASAWPRVAGDNYEKYTVQNAVEAQRWHVVSNQVGSVGYAEDYGHSRIVHPNGEIVADTGGREGMVVAEIDLYVGRDAVHDR